MGRQRKIPSYRLHKSSGRAVVTLRGKDHYLGVHGSPESREEYRRIVAEYIASGGLTATGRSGGYTVAELGRAYIGFAKGWYVKDGKTTNQVYRIGQAVAKLDALYGPTRAASFGPLALKAVRQAMIDARWTRRYCNSCTGCITRMFKWAVAEELIPVTVYQALRCVTALEQGRTTARESKPIRPVPEGDIEPALARCLPTVADMARLQLVSGARPGEICQLRPCDLDRSRPVWVYRPDSHKTEHHGFDRLIYFGPRAQALLQPYLDRDPMEHCFSPLEAMTADREAKGQRRKFGKRRMPGVQYTTMSYGRAIHDACNKAGVTPWNPHRLRHSAATLIRSQAGPDVARAVLGHQSIRATELYAERDAAAAAEAMGRLG